MNLSGTVILYSILYATFNVFGAAIIKNKLLVQKISAMDEFMFFLWDVRIVAALVLIVISMYFSIKALSLAHFSTVIPLMTAVNFVITVTIGVVYFREHLALTGYAGILLILCGIMLLGRGYQ